MGDKVAARAAMVAAGVPVVPGVASADPATVVSVGFPLLVKAAAGGGGRGMRVVRAEEDLAGALSAASAEAAAAFGDGTLYAERLLVNARHVEIQVLADAHGTCVALGERECSVQRRHQKVIEEAPCPGLDAGTRAAMGDAAVRAACAVGYRGAGTVEFLLGEDGAFYFLEMNTRIQVEHPITELTWGVDLVREQLRIAQGMRIDPANGSARGHAIEARLYAEDPARGYLPSPGPLLRFRMPSGPGIRVDTGYREGDSVPPDYDAMLAKVIAWAPTREHALARLDLALAETEVAGVVTNVEFLRDVLAAPEFAAGAVHTAWLSERFSSWAPPSVDDLLVVAARALADPSAREISRAPGSTAPTPWQVVGPLGRAR
jgi:acetyl-CoA/propionyl-CoA carboxylase biotin carboxyl carrier protein